jgi:hypothetical protein
LGPLVDAHSGQQLIPDKVVEDKHQHQRRHIAHQADVGAAYEAQKKAVGDAQQGHGRADDGGQHGGPDAQAQGGEQALDEQVGNPAAQFGVEAKQVLRDGCPVPLVVQGRLDAVGEIGARQDDGDDDAVVQGAPFFLGVNHSTISTGRGPGGL